MTKDLFVVVFLLAAICAQAQTAKIVGIGASSCAHFNEEIARSPSTQRDYFAWAQGFMSGVLLRAPLGQDEKLDLVPPSFPLSRQAAFLRRLWFPKIGSGRIRTVRQNQRIIAFDGRDPPLACSVYRQLVQVAAAA